MTLNPRLRHFMNGTLSKICFDFSHKKSGQRLLNLRNTVKSFFIRPLIFTNFQFFTLFQGLFFFCEKQHFNFCFEILNLLISHKYFAKPNLSQRWNKISKSNHYFRKFKKLLQLCLYNSFGLFLRFELSQLFGQNIKLNC